jgi:hypothetical protein
MYYYFFMLLMLLRVLNQVAPITDTNDVIKEVYKK